MTSPRKPTAGFWITVALVAVLVGYPLSFGPACWITSWCNLDGRWILVMYRPVIWLAETAPVLDYFAWYSLAGAADGWGWEIDLDGHFIQFGPQR